jgi:hypothetical protein
MKSVTVRSERLNDRYKTVEQLRGIYSKQVSTIELAGRLRYEVYFMGRGQLKYTATWGLS